jgi:hypothetical protein
MTCTTCHDTYKCYATNIPPLLVFPDRFIYLFKYYFNLEYVFKHSLTPWSSEWSGECLMVWWVSISSIAFSPVKVINNQHHSRNWRIGLKIHANWLYMVSYHANRARYNLRHWYLKWAPRYKRRFSLHVRFRANKKHLEHSRVAITPPVGLTTRNSKSRPSPRSPASPIVWATNPIVWATSSNPIVWNTLSRRLPVWALCYAAKEQLWHSTIYDTLRTLVADSSYRWQHCIESRFGASLPGYMGSWKSGQFSHKFQYTLFRSEAYSDWRSGC